MGGLDRELDRTALAPLIDHTVLGPETTSDEAHRVCTEATENGTNACIPPCYLETCRAAFPALTIATVVGFPHGQHTTTVKVEEAVDAADAGADELDVVCNVGRLRAGEDDRVRAELAAIDEAVSVPIKVIVESPLLTSDELDRACAAAREAGVAMVKTSTGFVDGGATVADVSRMAEYLPVKASGGVGTYEEAMAMFDAGAERIGTSSGVEILAEAPSEGR